MGTLKVTFRYIGLLFLVSILSFVFAEFVGGFYSTFFHEYSGFIDTRLLIGFFVSYTFFLSLFFVLGGEKNKYKWLAGFYIPIILFEFSSSFVRLWLFVSLAILGWLIGLGIRTLFTNFYIKKVQPSKV